MNQLADNMADFVSRVALNAAVAAARAGEPGRGFAALASEMRGLAGRSAAAAKELKDLIQDSVKKVEDGSGRVAQSGQTLEQLVLRPPLRTSRRAEGSTVHAVANPLNPFSVLKKKQE